MNAPINITPEEWNLIETWLDRNDSQDKAPLVDEQLAQIPTISQKIEHIKKVREEIKDSIRQSKIKEFHQHVSVDKKKPAIWDIANKKLKSTTVWYAAAAVFVLLFGIFWVMGRNNPSEKIFARNFKPDIGLPLQMNTSNATVFYEGMLDYKQENYKDAIEKWEVLLKLNPESDTLNYFLGVANLALGDALKSIEYLKNQERFRQGIFKEDAAYYVALAKIKEGKLKEARIFLKENPSSRNTNLLNELKER